jgi:tagatose-1,6-bisphosphate aldolase non-catalytic subunit AgaZ/GatZ
MTEPKVFIGPMSKNVVDAIIQFCNDSGTEIGLIPSRRQVEYNGGYVNNWTTQDFTSYVKSKTNKILIQRDHAGPGQGQSDDDGLVSLKVDSSCVDLIHIDPWKKYPDFREGLMKTASMIEYSSFHNSKVLFEVGTEEAIRRFEVSELEALIKGLQRELSPGLFEKIKYLVIQSGTSLKGTDQTGTYDSTRLMEMVALAKKYRLLSKEHNGDYIPVEVIKEKLSLGLDAINIAPEFGLIETLTYLDEIKDDRLFERFWQICYDSKKWVKWVSPGFDPYYNREQLVKICGHYVLSNPKFISEIKSQFPGIDDKVKQNVTKKLNELYS